MAHKLRLSEVRQLHKPSIRKFGNKAQVTPISVNLFSGSSSDTADFALLMARTPEKRGKIVKIPG